MARTFTTTFTALSFLPAATNGAAFVSHNVTYPRASLAFDDTTGEVATTSPIAMPDEYTGTGTLKARLLFYSDTAAIGTAAWSVECEAVTAGDTLDLAVSAELDSTANTGSTALSGVAGDLTATTIQLDNKDSVESGDLFRLVVSRDTSSDSVSEDLFLTAVELYEET